MASQPFPPRGAGSGDDSRGVDASGPPDAPAERGAPDDLHVTTFAHDGRFWDVALRFVPDPQDPRSARARLRFVPADRDEGEDAVETAVVIIEPSREEAERTAHGYSRHNLGAMLRSAS